jgi:hypothetical protein
VGDSTKARLGDNRASLVPPIIISALTVSNKTAADRRRTAKSRIVAITLRRDERPDVKKQVADQYPLYYVARNAPGMAKDVKAGGEYYFSSLIAGYRGVRVARLRWDPQE